LRRRGFGRADEQSQDEEQSYHASELT
jgi:hypothetical protein